jgi:hypothetical protein
MNNDKPLTINYKLFSILRSQRDSLGTNYNKDKRWGIKNYKFGYRSFFQW